MEPEKQDARSKDAHFADTELLYRRFPKTESAEILASAIRFDEPPSFCRGKYAHPEDVIHSNCASNRDVSRFGVFSIPVKATRMVLSDRFPQDTYSFEPEHLPEPLCYAHSELHCKKSCSIDNIEIQSGHKEPPRNIRKQFRAKIASALTEVIPAKN
jgi:hypothetical protein